jgi:MOSC domain-containing protein YiiM
VLLGQKALDENVVDVDLGGGLVDGRHDPAMIAWPRQDGAMTGVVTALHRSDAHTFSKESHDELVLLAGLGVEGDAHCGATVRHRSRVAADPTQPNLRQVHLMHAELFDEVGGEGFDVHPGDLGENITTRGIDLLGLATGTVLRVGDQALIAVTGLRNPCRQIEAFQSGLQGAVLDRDDEGNLVRKAGVMAVVVLGGTVKVGDAIEVQPPPGPPVPLQKV